MKFCLEWLIGAHADRVFPYGEFFCSVVLSYMRTIIVCMVAATQFLLTSCMSVEAQSASPRPPTRTTTEKTVYKPAVSTAEETPFWALAAVSD